MLKVKKTGRKLKLKSGKVIYLDHQKRPACNVWEEVTMREYMDFIKAQVFTSADKQEVAEGLCVGILSLRGN